MQGSPERESYISSRTKSKLGELLLQIAEEEQLIEKYRQTLAVLPEFEPYAAFTRIDRYAHGFITCKDINFFLKQQEVHGHSDADCDYLVTYFDSEGEGSLTYKE